mmetsp:Transcript_2587/g.3773  ORF Transcript_2587/g.3773 Transcript_2587/m.3773 type:complete len:154 (+) Transcript_2587:13-474(+)
MCTEITIQCQEKRQTELLNNGTDWNNFRSELKKRGALTSMSVRQLLLNAAMQSSTQDKKSSDPLPRSKADGPIKNMDLVHMVSKKERNDVGQRLWMSQTSVSARSFASLATSDSSRNLHDMEVSTTPSNKKTRSRLSLALNAAINLASLQDEI